MKRLIWLILACPILAYAQNDGVRFLENCDWQTIQNRAKAEHKYVFVDCYTTWCGPCRMMDKEVYVNDTIGRFMNEHFLSVKLQMDSTPRDRQNIRYWYPIARSFEGTYSVNAYPSYLFFSPEGQIVHKEVGEKSVEQFMQVASAALDFRQQFYTLLARYEEGKADPSMIRCLAQEEANFGNDSLSNTVASYYIHSVLDKLPADQLWTRENIEFIYRFAWSKIIDPHGRLFRLFYRDALLVDSIMGIKGYTQTPISVNIYYQQIEPYILTALTNNTEPDWRTITRSIQRDYNRFEVEKDMLYAYTRYYQRKKDWNNYVKYLMLGCRHDKDRFKHDGVFLNNCAFEVFKYSKNRGQLKTALDWANRAVELDANGEYLDTKANLLYKLGRLKEGREIEERSALLAPDDLEIKQNLEKMRTGLPTWKLN